MRAEFQKAVKPGSHDTQFSEEIQTAVRTELNAILSAPFFAQSKRCKNFLRYVVLQTLSGNAGQLKERMIGIRVFDRANDYDAGEDAIVRVTANDVRKRIGQFYQESRDTHPIQIDLPRGTYVPEFRIRLTSQRKEPGVVTALNSPAGESAGGGKPLPGITAPPPPPPGSDASIGGESTTAKVKIQRHHGSRERWLSLVLPALLLVTATVLLGIWKIRARDGVPQLWDSFRHAKTPVLVCMGTHNIPDAHVAQSAETEDVVMRTETIPIDDATVITSMARMLGSEGIPFRLVAADQTPFTDLQVQPVILIGAIDNQWTLQLTQALRYRIEVDYPSGADKPPVASIVDAKHPSTARWTTDFSSPLSGWKKDYAILAKETDPTIGVPVLIEAGLGNAGSLAASRFVVSGNLAATLRNEPSCRGKSNFEAVIQTDIIDTRPGPPHALRLICW